MVVEHEARHAVIADALGHTVLSIRTRQRGNSGGYTAFEFRDEMSITNKHWDQVLFSLAPVGINSGDPQNDDMSVFSHLTQIIGSGVRPEGVDCELTFSALYSEAIVRARALVDEHQDTINRLVAVLLQERTLSAHDFAEVMQEIRTAPSDEPTAPDRGGSDAR